MEWAAVFLWRIGRGQYLSRYGAHAGLQTRPQVSRNVKPSFGVEDIQSVFDPRCVERGRGYFREGRVEQVQWSGDGRQIHGQVIGSGFEPYQVEVSVTGYAERTRVSGRCSCPVGRDCKHVVAVLLAVLEMADGRESAPEPRPTDAVDLWLSGLRETVQQPDRKAASSAGGATSHCLIFVLHPMDWLDPTGQRGPTVHVRPEVAYRRRDGSFGSTRSFNLDRVGRYFDPPGYLDEGDLPLLVLLRARQALEGRPDAPLSGPGDGELLQKLLATGRCVWEETDGMALRTGEPRRATPGWSAPDDTGRQRPSLVAEPPIHRVLTEDPPWYLDLERGECGPLETELPVPLLFRWVMAPPVPPEALDRVRAALPAVKVALPPPAEIEVVEREVSPVPSVLMTTGHPRHEPGWRWMRPAGEPVPWIPLLRLRFQYERLVVSPADERSEVSRADGSRLIRIRRDRAAEDRVLDRLCNAGLEPDPRHDGGHPDEEGMAFRVPSWQDEVSGWSRFMLEVLPALRREGWCIEVDECFPYRVAEVSEWHFAVDASPGGTPLWRPRPQIVPIA